MNDPTGISVGRATPGSVPDGHWYEVRCGGVLVGTVFVPGGGPDAAAGKRSGGPAPAVSAQALAWRAVSRLPLPAPVVRLSPDGEGVVGVAQWFWLDGAGWRSLRQRTAAGPVWAEVEVSPVLSVWDPGDGSEPVRCAGPGTPYDRSRPAGAQRTDCSHVYARSSAAEPGSAFVVTASVTWRVTWRGSGGVGGVLPPLVRVGQVRLPVVERQSVVTGSQG